MKPHPAEIKEAVKYRYFHSREKLKSIAANLEISYAVVRKWVREWRIEKTR